MHDLQHGILHFDKGIFFTIKELFTRPGHSIREYIEGKRVDHFKPISLVIVLATIYGFLYHYFNINVLSIPEESTDAFQIFKGKLAELVGSKYFLVELLYLPVFSFASWLVFRKYHYNYIEHFILNAFITGQKLILKIILFPFLYFYDGTGTITIINAIDSNLGILISAWTFLQFFNKEKKHIVIRNLFFTYGILILIVGVISVVGKYAMNALD